MPKRFFLHVGSPKTGTTFLQEVLWSQRVTAEAQGLRLPLGSFNDHYLASVDARGLSGEPRYPRRVVGIWERLVADAMAWDGDVLVSHELFAATSEERVKATLALLDDVEVHVVLTARDLARQIPAEWQEHLKHRSTLTFEEFVQAIRVRSAAAHWFWTVQDYVEICRRWAAAVPVERIHVVTVPPAGSGPEVLWERFAGVLALDPTRFDLTERRANTSLRAEQAEVLRRVNLQLGPRLPLPGPYPGTVKEVFAQGVLSDRPGTAIGLQAANLEFAADCGRSLAAGLTELGVDVIGDLDDLAPRGLTPHGTEHPESLADEALLDETVEAVADLLDRFARRRGAGRPQSDLEWLVDDMQARPFHYVLVRMTERNRTLMRVRSLYTRGRRLPGRVRGRLRRILHSSSD